MLTLPLVVRPSVKCPSPVLNIPVVRLPSAAVPRCTLPPRCARQSGVPSASGAAVSASLVRVALRVASVVVPAELSELAAAEAPTSSVPSGPMAA